MTADEINRGLAKALGWKVGTSSGLEYAIRHDGTWLGLGHAIDVKRFNPAESVDDLRNYVLPEIVRRGGWDLFHSALHRAWIDKTEEYYMSKALLMFDAAVLAEAALEALEMEK